MVFTPTNAHHPTGPGWFSQNEGRVGPDGEPTLHRALSFARMLGQPVVPAYDGPQSAAAAAAPQSAPQSARKRRAPSTRTFVTRDLKHAVFFLVPVRAVGLTYLSFLFHAASHTASFHNTFPYKPGSEVL